MNRQTSSEETLIELRGVSKLYPRGDLVVKALDGIDLRLPERGMAAVVGPSGSGKSSLLHIVGAMDRPSNGEVVVAGQLLNTLPESGLTAFRRNTVGFVFQSFNLIPNLDALENVMLPMEFAGVAPGERDRRAKELLDRVGLAGRLTHRPRELSGGEQQRVALARAFVTRPAVLFADEPTGNLDAATGARVCDLLFEMNRDLQTTVVLVTHDHALAGRCARSLHMDAGRLA